jgi:hypothetical protein
MGVLCKKHVLAVMLTALLIACLQGQWAEIIEDFIPNDCVPYAVKQGSDGNLYMTMLDYSNPQQITIAFCIMNLHGQVLNYYAATQDEMNEMGYPFYQIPTPAFTLNMDNSIRFVYEKLVQVSEYQYESHLNWAIYSQFTGLTFQQGPVMPYYCNDLTWVTNLIQINSNRWIIEKHYGPNAILVNSFGDVLWNYSVYFPNNRSRWIQRLSDTHYIMNIQNGWQMNTSIWDDNGNLQYQYNTDIPINENYFSSSLFEYQDGSALVMYYTPQDSIIHMNLYQNNLLTDLFQTQQISVNGNNHSCCDEYGLLFSGSSKYNLFNTLGDLIWEYTLPDSFRCGNYRSQLVHIPEDSCYITIGSRYRGNDVSTPYLLRLHYGTVSNADYTDPVSKIAVNIFPNPFSSGTNLEINTRANCQAEVLVYNTKGQLVRSLGSLIVKSGINQLSWDGKDFYGNDTVRGLYFIKVKTNRQVLVKKCLKL